MEFLDQCGELLFKSFWNFLHKFPVARINFLVESSFLIQESQNIQFQSKISVIPHYRPFFGSHTFIQIAPLQTAHISFWKNFFAIQRPSVQHSERTKMTHNINNNLALCFVWWQKIRLVTFLIEFWVMPIFVHS